MTRVKLVQWNVLYQEKAENIIKLIEKVKPDIFCGQELTTSGGANPGINIPAKIAKTGRYDYFYKSTDVNFEEYETAFNFGDGIFSRFPIKAKREYRIQSKDEYEETRFYIEADILIDGQILTVGTVHLSFSPYFKMNEKRLAEAEKLFSIVKRHNERFILTGDMNATPDSPIIKKLESMFAHAGPDINRPTWTTKPFSYQGFTTDKLGWRLDYVFITEDLNVITDKIIGTPYSDHLPVMVELEV